jgi:hypothetical protein
MSHFEINIVKFFFNSLFFIRKKLMDQAGSHFEKYSVGSSYKLDS